MIVPGALIVRQRLLVGSLAARILFFGGAAAARKEALG